MTQPTNSTASWQRFAVSATIAALVLLIASNVLLLQIVLDDKDGANNDRKSGSAALPDLPAPSSTSSSRALLKEIDRTKKQFKKPLGQALTELESVSSSAATLDQLPVLLEQLVASTSQLGSAAPDIQRMTKQLKSMIRQFKRMSAFVIGLGPVVVDLEKTIREMAADTERIKQCAEKPSTCN